MKKKPATPAEPKPRMTSGEVKLLQEVTKLKMRNTELTRDLKVSRSDYGRTWEQKLHLETILDMLGELELRRQASRRYPPTDEIPF